MTKQNLEILLKKVDDHQDIFSGSNYTSLENIFDEPAIRESDVDRLQASATFMARRLQQAMPLSATMSPAEESSLDNIIRDVGRWKERNDYNYGATPVGGEEPNNNDVKHIQSTVRGHFIKLGLHDISFTSGNGYLTWRANEFLGEIIIRLTFDIRKKYNWRMRFNFGIFAEDGSSICHLSDWEIFGKIIWAAVGLNFNVDFEHCDRKSSDFISLNNYLNIIASILKEIRCWYL